MTITEALKNSFFSDMRVTNFDKWLVYNYDQAMWVVYQKKYRQRGTTVILETFLESEAVKELLRDE
jgi:hypothetical protein